MSRRKKTASSQSPELDRITPPARLYDISRKLRRAQILTIISGVSVVVLALVGKIHKESYPAMYGALIYCFVAAPLLLEFAIRSYRKKKQEQATKDP
ncbi:MAG TPA: hypothetical protein V6C81_20005 [Planktothrix sp.]|jgi:hypothetical protein